MAYDYEKAKAAYESLTPEQQQQYVDRNKNNATVQQFARDYAREKSQASTTTPTPSYQNQGAGNYVYNEKTWFYENQTDTSKNTVNQWITPRPETIKQETPIKQEETAISTDTKNNKNGTMTPLSNDYYNQTSDEALNKIRYNLNWYKQSNPEYFSDYETFKRNFSYDLRNQEQQWVLDDFYKWYEKGLELSATPVNDLYTQYKDGQISLNDLELLKWSNPTKYAELQEQINKASILAAYDDTEPTEEKTLQEMAYEYMAKTFNSFMNGDYTTESSKIFEEYKANMDNPEMLELQDKTTELDEQYKNIEDQIASMTKEVEKEYEGTWASRSKINAIVADRTYDLQQQLRTIGNEYNKYATQYNNRATQYQNEFQLQLQEYQVNMQARNQQMKELWFAMDLMNFETNEQKQQREWDYWVKQQEYTNWNINSKDYDTRYKAALKSVQNLLSQYEWIPMVRSAEQMAQDVLTAIDNGSNLGAELTKINQQIQQKPEYKYLYNNTYGTSQWFGKTINIWWTDYVEYDGKLYTADEFNKKYGGAKNKANYNVVSDDVLMTYSEGREHTFGSFMANPKHNDKEYGWQCGAFVNDYLEEIWAWRPFGNEDITTREWWMNRDKDSPKIWTVAVFDYNNYSSDGKNHWHVAIVISRPDKDGNFWVKDSNYDKDWIIKTRKVNIKDASLKWFIDPTLDQNWNKWVTLTSNSSNGNTTIPTNIDTSKLWITQSQLDDLAKDYINGERTYSDIDKTYWTDILNAVGKRALELMEWGYEKSTIITDPVKLSNTEKSWRDFYDKKAKEAQETLDWVNKMEEAYNLIDTDKNAASQAITIAYNKILDPGSVVREWEYARSAEWQSYLSQIQAKLEKMKDGWAWLTKNELKSMINVAKKFSENAKKVQLDAAKQAQVAINKYGLTPEIVLPVDVWNKINTAENNSDWTINMPTTWGTASTWSSVSTWIINTTTWFNIPMSWSSFS